MMTTQRSFIPGSPWLYYKIYMGTRTTDIILSEVILPTAELLLEEGVIDRWFFIRYRDPDHHLRVRFYSPSSSGVGFVMQQLQQRLEPFVQQDQIWKVQLDTYHRELERYGADTIEWAEEIFFRDSEMIARMVGMIEGKEGEELRWLFGLKATDHFLDQFDLSMQSKMELLKEMKLGFAKEFGVKKALRNQINKRYSEQRNKIADFMMSNEMTAPDYAPLFEILETKAQNIRVPVKGLLHHSSVLTNPARLEQWLSSYIHMLMNRLFKSRNRQHELVLYDFLFRYYMAVISKSKKNKISYEKC